MKRGTINCILCSGLVSYCNSDTSRFVDHMTYEHGVSQNSKFLLAGSLMSEDERDAIITLIEEREANKNGKILKRNDNENLKQTEVSCESGAVPSKPNTVDTEKNKSNMVSTEVIKKINCPQCDSKFSSGKSLRMHLLHVHKIGNMSLQPPIPTIQIKNCKLCSFSCLNKKQLKVHHSKKHASKLTQIRSINGDDEGINGGKDILSSYSTLADQTYFTCFLCGGTFSNKGNLKRHLKSTHKGNEDEPVIKVKNEDDSSMWHCQVCHYRSPFEKSLKMHISRKHNSLKFKNGNWHGQLSSNLECSSATILKAHKDLKHFQLNGNNGDKKESGSSEQKSESSYFECRRCEFVSFSENDMYNHERQHSSSRANAGQKLFLRDQISVNAFEPVQTCRLASHSFDTGQVLSVSDEILSLEILNHSNNFSSCPDATKTGSINESGVSDQLSVFRERKTAMMAYSEYFKAHPNTILNWLGDESELAESTFIPQGYGLHKLVSKSGKLFTSYVTPDRVMKLRSLKALLEFMKLSGMHSEDELNRVEARL